MSTQVFRWKLNEDAESHDVNFPARKSNIRSSAASTPSSKDALRGYGRHSFSKDCLGMHLSLSRGGSFGTLGRSRPAQCGMGKLGTLCRLHSSSQSISTCGDCTLPRELRYGIGNPLWRGSTDRISSSTRCRRKRSPAVVLRDGHGLVIRAEIAPGRFRICRCCRRISLVRYGRPKASKLTPAFQAPCPGILA